MDPSSTPAGWYSDSYVLRNYSKLFQETKTGGGGDGGNEWSFSLDFDSKQDKFSTEKCYMTEEEMVVTGPVVSRSHSLSTTSLMQNCDLPPPVKVFNGVDKTVRNPMRPKKHISKINQQEHDESTVSKNVGETDKLELMKALQLSQSRARTAEKKASVMAQERDQLSTLLLKESLRLFAHRQWVKLLQLEVSQLNLIKQNRKQCSNYEDKADIDKGSPKAEDGEDGGGLTWCMALALCLGIAGVGFAVGCGYFF